MSFIINPMYISASCCLLVKSRSVQTFQTDNDYEDTNICTCYITSQLNNFFIMGKTVLS